MTGCVVRVVTTTFLLHRGGGAKEKGAHSVGWRVMVRRGRSRVLCEPSLERAGGSLLGEWGTRVFKAAGMT